MNVRGRFVPRLLQAVVDALGLPNDAIIEIMPAEVEVWLRVPPRLEAIAEEVRRLYEQEGLGFRLIGKKLGLGCGYIYQAYLRYYGMRGLPVPPRRPRGRSPSA
jgi:hypothetical protein